MSDEIARVALLRAVLLEVNGDDAAVLAPDLVWTVDAQVDGTHFRTEWLSWEDVGFRSLMAAASDLAAMGAEPVAALASLVLAPSVDDAALEAIARGQAAAAREIGAPVVGGNLARGQETSITTTVLGRSAAPILRSGARVGDSVWLAGQVGLSAAGLAALEKNVQHAHLATSLAAWRRPRARFADGRAMRGLASAAIDVSDGLARDAFHVARASGVRVVLDGAAILHHGGPELAAAASAVGGVALDLALHGGEDYALLATASASIPLFSRVGVIEAGDGVFVGDTRIDPRGFDHFAHSAS